jgi:hypothetical protein
MHTHTRTHIHIYTHTHTHTHTYIQLVLEIVRYMPVYHTGNSFIPEFHADIHNYTLYPFIFCVFLSLYPSFLFKKYEYTDTHKFAFRALHTTY